MLLDKVEIQIFTHVIDILTTECKTNAGIKKKIKLRVCIFETRQVYDTNNLKPLTNNFD